MGREAGDLMPSIERQTTGVGASGLANLLRVPVTGSDVALTPRRAAPLAETQL